MIGRLLLHVGALTGGIVIGAALVLATTPAPAVESGPPPSARPTPNPIEAKAAPLPTPTAGILLAWTPERVPGELPDAAAAIEGVVAITTVHAGPAELIGSTDPAGEAVDDLAPGWVIPIDAIAVDPASFSEFATTADRRLVERLRPGQVLLGTTSASLRQVEVGGTLELTGGSATPHVVAGIVDDATIGGAELAVHRDDELAADFQPRYVLVRHAGDRATVDAALQAAAGDVPIRVRAPGETPFLRHGDAVLPQALVKARYGEFAYRRSGGNAVEPDPAWVADNIETRDLPVLGSVTCHRAILDPLGSVLADLDRRGLAHTIDPDSYEGCWNPRLIANSDELSRHAWGIAIDLNASGNPTGSGSGQPPELVEVLTERGWGWGGTWLIPDPMHFELVDPVPAETIKVVP